MHMVAVNKVCGLVWDNEHRPSGVESLVLKLTFSNEAFGMNVLIESVVEALDIL
jgi:hypothetical protein